MVVICCYNYSYCCCYLQLKCLLVVWNECYCFNCCSHCCCWQWCFIKVAGAVDYFSFAVIFCLLLLHSYNNEIIVAPLFAHNHFNCLHSFYMLLIVCIYNCAYVHKYVKLSTSGRLSFFGPSKSIVGLTVITARHWLPPPRHRDRHQIKYCLCESKQQCKIRRRRKKSQKNPKENIVTRCSAFVCSQWQSTVNVRLRKLCRRKSENSSADPKIMCSSHAFMLLLLPPYLTHCCLTSFVSWHNVKHMQLPPRRFVYDRPLFVVAYLLPNSCRH